ncbi:thioredoxin family protein [Pseudomonas sp. FP453]|uniref:thioredoxin family protein n=1 Tax=Pseudomonas sp. FP453 TaxID=2954094 RepID=UPI002732F9EE|nr:thioredoxin family protein [Pseudomonas sp. FP453]WLH88059.1 thioredoxin family protein [Pseudomonas sp. FP453]
MGLATATIANAEDYQRVLSSSRPVFLLFVSAHCPACTEAVPLFEMIAARYPSVMSLVLDCAHTPRHGEVTGTPTGLVYVNGQLQEKLQGFGPEEGQAALVEATFKRYAKRRRPIKPTLARP